MSATTRPRAPSGTQSPPLQDSEPMGVSSIRGDHPHGVPDRVQRAQYFPDEPEPAPKVNKDPSSEDKIKPGTNLWETSATADEPMRKLNAEQSATHELEQQGTNNVWDTTQKQPAARAARFGFETK